MALGDDAGTWHADGAEDTVYNDRVVKTVDIDAGEYAGFDYHDDNETENERAEEHCGCGTDLY